MKTIFKEVVYLIQTIDKGVLKFHRGKTTAAGVIQGYKTRAEAESKAQRLSEKYPDKYFRIVKKCTKYTAGGWYIQLKSEKNEAILKDS